MQSQYYPTDTIIKHRARYAILGAIIGDAAGTTTEFQNSNMAKRTMAKYDNYINGLVGTGPFNLLPGQFTDDTEMALAIMSVIHHSKYYNQDAVAKAYHDWHESKPFDMGNTTRNSVSQPTTTDMLKAAKIHNINSLSNGFLMRTFGLIGLYYDKSSKDLVNAIVSDVVLTHSNIECIRIAVIYGKMLHNAILGDNAKQVYEWGKKRCHKSVLLKIIYQAVENNDDNIVYCGVKYNLSDADTRVCGFVGFAFWFLLIALRKYMTYRDAILNVISYGGDTDTNACIVGAVMGALYSNTIPTTWINSVINCNAVERYKNYPIANPKVWTKWLP